MRLVFACFALTCLSIVLFPAIVGATLNVAVEARPDPVQPGESMRVAITVTNPGPTNSGPITLQLPYPANLSSVDELYISDGGGCSGISCEMPETIIWTLSALGPGQGRTVTFAPTAAPGTPDGATILFDVDALENGALAASAQRQVRVIADRLLEIAVDESRDPAVAGGSLLYEITYGNSSAETMTGTELTFTVPAGTSFASASDGGVFSGGVVRWNLGTLSGREGGRRAVSVNVGAGQVPGAIVGGALAAIEGQGDFAAHQTQFVPVMRIEAATGSRLIVNMALNPDPAVPGEALRAAITVTNPTGFFLNNVQLRLRYPNGLESQDEALISDGGGCSGISCDDREELIWNLGDLAPGRGTTVTFAPEIDSVSGGTLVTFPIAVDADGQSRRLIRQTVLVRESRIFDLAVDAERSPVAANGRLVYILTYGNLSSETTTGTTLRFPLPGGTSFVSASGGGGALGGAVVWNLGDLPGRQGGQRQVEVQVGAIAAGAHLVVDLATISGQGSFLFHETRSRSLARVENGTRLDVAVTLDRDPVLPDERTSLVATVTNRSATDFANNVVLRWRHPGGFRSVDDGDTIFGGACSGISCDDREVATWNLGTLPPGAGVVVELPPQVQSLAAGGSVITHPIQVDATDRSRTRASHSVLVQEARALDLSVDADLDPGDGSVTFAVTYGNRSGDPVTGATLIVPVPAGLVASGVSDNADLEDGAELLGESLVWNLGTLPARRTGRRLVRFDVGAGVGAGDLARVFDAEISGQGPFFPEVTRSRNARRMGAVSRTLRLSGAPEPVSPNALLTMRADLANTSGGFLFDPVLRMRFPAAVGSLSDGTPAAGGACPGISCDESELVLWNLADLPPGGSLDLTFAPTVESTAPRGSLIRYWGRFTGASFGQAAASTAVPVGADFDDAGPLQVIGLFVDGFESGDTSKWSATVQ
ncbi:MAG: hypothetical protein AAGM22_07505 [Acidobacteriota bacterium]